MNTTYKILRLIVPLGIMAPALAVAEDLLIYDGDRDTGYQMFVGDRSNWNLAVSGQEFSSANERVKISPSEQAGALKASWKGRGEGQLYLSSTTPKDLTQMLEADGALAFFVRLEQPPKKQTVLRMGCGYPCAGNADVTKLLQALPENEWLKVAIDLQCFTKQGLDPSKVDTPFLLLTTGRLSLEVADIRLVPGLGETSAVRC